MANSITQDMKYRQSLMKYAAKYGVSRASRKYNKSRSYIYFWKKRWDGTVESPACQSRRPHSHPNQHTEAEWKLIRDTQNLVWWSCGIVWGSEDIPAGQRACIVLCEKWGCFHKKRNRNHTNQNLMNKWITRASAFKSMKRWEYETISVNLNLLW